MIGMELAPFCALLDADSSTRPAVPRIITVAIAAVALWFSFWTAAFFHTATEAAPACALAWLAFLTAAVFLRVRVEELAAPAMRVLVAATFLWCGTAVAVAWGVGDTAWLSPPMPASLLFDVVVLVGGFFLASSTRAQER